MAPARYALGYPRSAAPDFRRELAGWFVGLLVTVAVAWGAVEAWMTPPPRGWRTIALLVLGPSTVMFAADLVQMAVRRLGLRIVPRFSPPLPERPDTYLHGRALIRALESFDRDAATAGVRPLIEFGLEPASAGGWFECAEGRRTIAALGTGGTRESPRHPAGADLERIDAALAAGEAAGARFRLEIAGGDGMNGMLWDHLRQEGY